MSNLSELVCEMIDMEMHNKQLAAEDVQIYWNGLSSSVKVMVARAIYSDDQDEWRDFMVNVMEHEDFGMGIYRFMFEDADNWLYNVVLQSIKENPRFEAIFENELAHQISNMLDKNFD